MSQDLPDAAVLARACPRCGAVGSARFCGECGQPLLAAAEVPSGFRALVRESAVEVLGLDRRLLATLRDLVLHPRRIVLAHVEGHAAGYVQPLKLFLLLGGLYLLALRLLLTFTFDTLFADAEAPVSITRIVFGSAEALQRALSDHGLTMADAAERFGQRVNSLTPLVTAFALLPLAGILALLQPQHARRAHFAFLLVTSNAIWLLNLLMLPLAFAGESALLVGTYAAKYAYCAIGFFAVYPGRSRAATALRFGGFVLAELIISSIVSLLLTLAIMATIVYP